MSKHKLTICGSFGFGNAGDEAVPLAIADLAEAQGIDLDIRVLGRYDKPELSNVVGIGAQDSEAREQLKGNPMLVIGGGVIEPTDTCVLSRCSPYLRKSFAPKLGLYAVNVESGTDYSWLRRFRVNNVLQQFDRFYVRDLLSAEVLRSLMPHKEVETIGDSVLWMKPAATIPKKIEEMKPFIAVTLASRWLNDSALYEWLAAGLSELATRLKASIVFLPCAAANDDDCLVHRRVADGIQGLNPTIDLMCVEEQLEPRQVAAILGNSILTVGMRLHGCIMAYAQKVPFVALAYHPKVLGFARTVGWEKFCLPHALPQNQSQGTYGYRFSDTKMIESDLVKTAFQALEYSNFDRLHSWKICLAEAFLDFWQFN